MAQLVDRHPIQVTAHAWVSSSAPSRGRAGGSWQMFHMWMFLSFNKKACGCSDEVLIMTGEKNNQLHSYLPIN